MQETSVEVVKVEVGTRIGTNSIRLYTVRERLYKRRWYLEFG